MPLYDSSATQYNFFVDLTNGASGNTGKGWYKIDINSGGTSTITAWTHYVEGVTSGAKARVTNLTNSSGTFGGGDWTGTIHILQPIGTFQNGEDIKLMLVADDTQVSANVGTTTSLATTDGLDKVDSVTAAKGLATTANLTALNKTSAWTSLAQNATFTKSSRTVTLTSALTYLISDCESITGWTAYNSASRAVNTTRKSGSNAIRLTFPNPAVADTKYLVYDLGSTQDLSSYTGITLWLGNANISAGANDIVIKLCSDADGDTAVETFTVPDAMVTTIWYAITLNKGSALSSTVRSIAIYSGATPTALNAGQMSFDNINACNPSTLCLDTQIGVSDYTKGMYPVKSINGTDIQIDESVSSNSTTGRGYANATTTETIYALNTPKKFAAATATNTAIQTVPNVTGLDSAWITWEGGVDMQYGVVNGWTYFNGRNGYGYGIATGAPDNHKLSNMVLSRYYIGQNGSNTKVSWLHNIAEIGITSNANLINKITGNYLYGCNSVAKNLYFPHGSGDLYIYSNTATSGALSLGATGYLLGSTSCRNNSGYAVNLTGGDYVLNNLLTTDNVTGSVNYSGSQVATYLKLFNANISESTEIGIPTIYAAKDHSYCYSEKHDGTLNNDITFFRSSTITKQASTKPSDVNYAWKASPTASTRRSALPVRQSWGKFYVAASSEVTISFRGYKDNSAINGRMMVLDDRLGIVESSATITNTTDFADGNCEYSFTFTPTSAGFVELWAETWYPDTSTVHTYNVYFAPPKSPTKLVSQA